MFRKRQRHILELRAEEVSLKKSEVLSFTERQREWLILTMTYPNRLEMQLQRCLMFIQLPSHGHTLHYHPALPLERPAEIIGRKEEGKKYLSHLVDCVLSFSLAQLTPGSSLLLKNCLKSLEWPLLRGQQEERGCGAWG